MVYIMEELLDWMEYIEDVRQARKVRHKLKDILVIVLLQHWPMQTTGWKLLCLLTHIRIICENI